MIYKMVVNILYYYLLYGVVNINWILYFFRTKMNSYILFITYIIVLSSITERIITYVKSAGLEYVATTYFLISTSSLKPFYQFCSFIISTLIAFYVDPNILMPNASTNYEPLITNIYILGLLGSTGSGL